MWCEALLTCQTRHDGYARVSCRRRACSGRPDTWERARRRAVTAGGEVAYFMTAPDGRKIRGWWRVTAVDPPRALAFTDGYANPDGTPNADSPTTAVQMRLAEQDGGTRMHMRFVFESSEHMEQLERWGAFDVFSQSVAQMDALLARGAADVRQTNPS